MCPANTLRNNVTCEGVRVNMKGLISVCTISVKAINCAKNPVNEFIKSVILKGWCFYSLIPRPSHACFSLTFHAINVEKHGKVWVRG